MIELTEEQVLYFRARRGHLTGPGAANARAAASAILGAQAQQLPPSLLALSLRTRGRPTAHALRRELFDERRTLVRAWSQRETLFIFAPSEDWSLFAAARERLAPAGRRGPMPSEATLDKALLVLEKAGRPLTRTDLVGVAPKSYERELARAAQPQIKAGEIPRFAAGRLFWRLAMRGDVCVGEKLGAEQTYAARTTWFPKLKWRLAPPLRACATLARHYLSSYGPATVTDVAHFFGARVKEVRQWIDAIADELIEVSCGDRKGLLALAQDARALKTRPPAAAAKWPVRLLPLWDSLLMGHADKSWTVPEEAERKLVWRKGAYVTPVVLARGRVVATWSHKMRKRGLEVEVQPLGGWSERKHLAGVRREAEAVAKHLGGLEGSDVAIHRATSG